MPRGDRGGESRGSGVRCVAANCGNTNAHGVSMHKFPKDSRLRKQWSDFVKAKRVWTGPTEYSALCSEHFTIECFPFKYFFEKEHMGIFPKKVQLNKDAIPTIHADPVPSTPSTSKSFGGPKLEILSTLEDATYQNSPPKKIRRGYAKREAQRVRNCVLNL